MPSRFNKSLDSNLDAFLEHLLHERAASKGTIGTYRADLEEFITILSEEELALEGTQADIQPLREYLRIVSEMKTKHGKFIVSQSVSRKLSTVRSFLRYLTNQGIFSMNAARLIKGPKGSKRLPLVVSERVAAQALANPDLS